MDIFSILESSQDISKKEDAIVLLSYYVKYTAKHIIDYIDMIFSTLIKFLKYEDTESDKDDSSIDDENRCRKRQKSTEIKGFRGLPSKPEAARNPFQTFSSSNLHTEKAEMRGYRLDICVARLQVRYERG